MEHRLIITNRTFLSNPQQVVLRFNTGQIYANNGGIISAGLVC